MSEIDAPIEAVFEVCGAKTTVRKFLSEVLIDGRGSIKQTPARAFFDRLTVDREWHSVDEKVKVLRFRKLEELMVGSLSDLSAYRAGRVRIEIFVIGHDADGNIAGIRTTAVET